MKDEKLPKEYDSSVIQRVLEGIKGAIGYSSKKQSEALFDASQEIKDSVTKLANKVSKLAGEEGEQGRGATFVPPPQNLSVYEFVTWGFAHLDPFFRWKFKGMIVGYELYGSMNVADTSNPDFEVHEDNYTQYGIHTAYPSLLEGDGVTIPNTYLHTEAGSQENKHVFDIRLVKPIAANRLTLENITRGTSGTIGGTGITPALLTYGLDKPKYKLKALDSNNDPLEWYDGDQWRIKNYPSNRLFNIGALAIFSKRAGTFYIKARSIGKGHSYSQFTAATPSEGISSDTGKDKLATPKIVMPVHNCGGNIRRECSLPDTGNADAFKPVCPVHGIVPWTEIVSGTRETDHFSFFGFEACNVEFVWEEIDDADADATYQTKRKVIGPDPEDEEDEEREEG